MPAVTADRTIERTDKPLHITKRIGSTTYKVSVHFSRTSRETMSDKLVRLIERDAVKQLKRHRKPPRRTAGKREP